MTELTGRHVAAIFGTGFATIIGVNLVLATHAVATFPGLETRNTYVASQVFDRARAAQEALGWTARAWIKDGTELIVTLEDAHGPAPARITRAVLGRATSAEADQELELRFDGTAYRAPVAAAQGRWTLRIEAEAPERTRFRQHITAPHVAAGEVQP